MSVDEIARRDFLRGAGLATVVFFAEPVELFTGGWTSAVASNSQIWTGIHKKLLDEYEAMKSGKLDPADSLPRYKKQIINFNWSICGKGEGIAGTSLARVEIGVNGLPETAGKNKDAYNIITPPGIREYLPAEMLANDPSYFDYIKKVYDAGGTIQMLGYTEEYIKEQFTFFLIDEYKITSSTPRIFHPGRTLATSYIGEIIDSQDAPDGFKGRPTSKIYKVDPKTAKAGIFVGCLVDVYTPRAREGSDGPVNFVVKKFIGNDDNIPEFIFVDRKGVWHSKDAIEFYEKLAERATERVNVILPNSRLPGENLPALVRGLVFDEKGSYSKAGVFHHFDAPLAIAGINRPEVYSY